MADSVSKKELTDAVYEKLSSGGTNVTKAFAGHAVNALIEAIGDALVDGNNVDLRGVGIFKIKEKPAGFARNPKTGEKVATAAKKLVRFTPSKILKDKL